MSMMDALVYEQESGDQLRGSNAETGSTEFV